MATSDAPLPTPSQLKPAVKGTSNENTLYRTLVVGPKYGKLIPNRIFVGGIRGDTTEADLQRVFSAYGNVVSAKVVIDSAGISKGYGFVTFATEQEVQRLQRAGEAIILKERKLNIAPAFKKQHLVTNDAIYYSPLPRTVFGQRWQNQLAASCTGGGAGAGNDMHTFCPPAMQYQPLYQYYGVPMDVPAFWP